jgi:transmembrane sensor
VVFDRSRGVRITSTLRSSVRREPRGIRVLDGQVSFEVEHRAVADGPVRVLVSGGAIEVHGTRFTVVETGAGTGAVELHEGAIDFTDERGVVHVLQPGQTLRWPAPEAEPSVAPELDLSGVPDPAPLPGPMKAPPRTKSPLPQEADWRTFDQRVHAEAVITELGELRSRGAWSDAVRLLERELNRGAPDTRERLSFEVGLIYTWQVRDHAAACGHWARHRAEYPEGRFDAEVDRATASLGCER